jgi:hypothetical protein
MYVHDLATYTATEPISSEVTSSAELT